MQPADWSDRRTVMPGTRARAVPGSPVLAALLAATLAAGLGFGCGNDSTGPEPEPTVQSIIITSSIDTLLAVGRSAVLSAEARDASGGVVSATFTWSSNDTSVLTIRSSGQAYGVNAGTTTVKATANGVAGTLRMRVVRADLTKIHAALSDPYVSALIAQLENNRTVVQAAWSSSIDACGTGHLVQLSTDLGAISAQATSAAAHDRAVLGTLMLFVDHVTRLLNL